jgi:hypothetical protein
MSRGRPRRFGAREGSGRLARIKSAERKALIGPRDVVLSQPHRRAADLGDALDQKQESALGRFIIHNKLRPELYQAGLQYGNLVRYSFTSIGANIDIHETPCGSGLGVSAKKTKQLAAEVAKLDGPLRKLNPIGYAAVRTLAVHEREIAREAEQPAIIVLHGLARLLR